MKWLIASDIHGSAYYCRKLLEAFSAEKADRILLLGDILYHGPRNDLPKDYSPKEVCAMLNEHSSDIFAVCGNCDADIDKVVLDFPISSEMIIIPALQHAVIATHGHIYNQDSLPKMHTGDILLCGHFHVPAVMVHENYIYMNPGSVSIPKENSCHSYMTYENGHFSWKNVDTLEEYMSYNA